MDLGSAGPVRPFRLKGEAQGDPYAHTGLGIGPTFDWPRRARPWAKGAGNGIARLTQTTFTVSFFTHFVSGFKIFK